MSSHHIVRDDQEPALLLCEPNICSVERLHELLEWSPLVYALPDCFDWVEQLQLKVDVFVVRSGEGESLRKRFAYQWPFDVAEIDRGQSLLSGATLAMKLRELPALNIVKKPYPNEWNWLPSSLFNVSCVFYYGKWKGVFSDHYQKWLLKGVRLFIKSTSIKNAFRIEGAEQIGENTWQVIHDGCVELKTKEKVFLAEELAGEG